MCVKMNGNWGANGGNPAPPGEWNVFGWWDCENHEPGCDEMMQWKM